MPDCEADRGPLDFVFLFAKSIAELEHQLTTAAKALAPAGMLWVSWPKQASGIATDLTGNLVWQRGLDAGLVDVKVCAVTDIWSGLKFVIPVKNRPQEKRRIDLNSPRFRSFGCLLKISSRCHCGEREMCTAQLESRRRVYMQ